MPRPLYFEDGVRPPGLVSGFLERVSACAGDATQGHVVRTLQLRAQGGHSGLKGHFPRGHRALGRVSPGSSVPLARRPRRVTPAALASAPDGSTSGKACALWTQPLQRAQGTVCLVVQRKAGASWALGLLSSVKLREKNAI